MARTNLYTNFNRISTVIGTTATSTADVYLDVNNSALNLTPGTWEVSYVGYAGIINATAGVIQAYGNVAITDSSNNVLDNAVAFLGVGFDSECCYSCPCEFSCDCSSCRKFYNDCEDAN